MTAPLGPDQVERLVRELCRLPAETPWVEFKLNNGDPDMVGDLVSALSNAAALHGRDKGWLVWGVEDATHAVKGTTFVPGKARKGAQDLEGWLVGVMDPKLHIRFHEGPVGGKAVVVLEVPAARDQPTAVNGRRMIRVGSAMRSLTGLADTERDLWRAFDRQPFELRAALADQPAAEVLRLLDAATYFRLTKTPAPSDRSEVLRVMEQDRLVRRNAMGGWDVTNLGAILLAVDLGAFPGLDRKAVRMVVYKGGGRTATERERQGRLGYAAGFEPMLEYLGALLPSNEVIGRALRQDVPMYPDLALRELVANALVHQDFTITGTGLRIEVFLDRVEVSNPGTPLNDIDRLINDKPRSRNESLAGLMRRMGVCEELGTGIDKIVEETEKHQLPPPRWTAIDRSTRAVLFAPKDFRDMDRAERVHACYLHACLLHERMQPMTNTTLRERFGIEERNSATASRIIKDALDEGRIRPYDPDQGKRNARYLPHWA